MSETDGDPLTGPDLRGEGAAIADIPDPGMLLGHVNETNVVLVRKAGAVYGIGATCTHYGGPIGEGLFDGELVRCPLAPCLFPARDGRGRPCACHRPSGQLRG